MKINGIKIITEENGEVYLYKRKRSGLGTSVCPVLDSDLFSISIQRITLEDIEFERNLKENRDSKKSWLAILDALENEIRKEDEEW